MRNFSTLLPEKNDLSCLKQNSFYDDVFTLDKDSVLEAWEKLSLDILPLQVSLYPQIFHRALLKTIQKDENV